jgi:hypothetical protein
MRGLSKVAPVVECEPTLVQKVVIFALFCAVATLSATDEMRIIPLVRDGHVYITFQMADGYTDDVRAAIRSGLKTTFTYSIDLRTSVAVWLDRTVESTVVSTSVQYDNLTRRHTVVRAIDGRVEEAQVIEDDEAIRALVTKLDRLPLFRTLNLEANREYYVRVRAEVRPRNASFLWPWGSGRSAQAKFTFIP